MTPRPVPGYPVYGPCDHAPAVQQMEQPGVIIWYCPACTSRYRDDPRPQQTGS